MVSPKNEIDPSSIRSHLEITIIIIIIMIIRIINKYIKSNQQFFRHASFFKGRRVFRDKNKGIAQRICFFKIVVFIFARPFFFFMLL